MAEQQYQNEIIPLLNTAEQVNTSQWTDIVGDTTSPHLVPDIDPYPEIPLVKVADFTDQMKGPTYQTGMMAFGSRFGRGGSGKIDWSQMNPNAGKISLTETVNLTDTHSVLSDGTTWVPKYKSYIHGTNNEARLANLQTPTEKFFNPVKRLVANTTKGIGDVGAAVYGMLGAAFTGRLDTMYDNDFSHWLEKQTEITNLNYKNYYRESEKNQGFGLNTNTWDKFLGGAEFTTRLLFGEAVLGAAEAALTLASGGTALPTLAAAKAGRIGARVGTLGAKVASKVDDVSSYAKSVSKAVKAMSAPEVSAARKGLSLSNESKNVVNLLNATDDIARGADNINRAANTRKMFDNVRFALVTPSYEAGMEAREFRKQAETDFYDFYQRNYNRAPTAQEVNNFSKKMDGAANAVFGLNMGILGLSNMALFSDMVGLKNPISRLYRAPSEAFNKAVMGIGTRRSAATGLHEAIKGTAGQKIARFAVPIGSGVAIEGFWEEGGQGVASKSLRNYVASTYDPAAAETTAELGDAFAKALKDQFSTSEGIEEVLIGSIIGGLFGGVGGGFSNRADAKKQERVAQVYNAGEAFVKEFETNKYRGDWHRALVGHGNRFKVLRDTVAEAENSGDILGAAKAKRETLVSLLQAYSEVGREADFLDMMKASIEGVDNVKLSESLGITVEDADSLKSASIKELDDTANLYKKVFEAGRNWFKSNVVGGEHNVSFGKDSNGKEIRMSLNGTSYASALAYSSVMGDFYKDLAADAWDGVIKKVGNSVAGVGGNNKMIALGAIMSARETHQKQFKAYSEELAELSKQLEEVEHALSQTSETGDGQAVKRADLVSKYNQLNAEKTKAEDKAKRLFTLMTESFYDKMNFSDFGTYSQLSEFTDLVEGLNEVVDALPEDSRAEVDSLIEVFKASNDNYKDFANMYDKLMNPNAKIQGVKGINTPLGDAMKPFVNRKSKFASDEVKQALAAIRATVDGSKRDTQHYNELMNVAHSPVTQEHLDSSESNPGIDYHIAKRIERGIKLNDLEEQYYQKFGDNVDNALNNTKPSVNGFNINDDIELDEFRAELQAAKKRLEDFENGIYTPEEAEERDNIVQVIDDLTNRTAELRNKYSDEQARLTKEYSEAIREHGERLKDLIKNLNNKIAWYNIVKTSADYTKFGYKNGEDGTYYGNTKISDSADDVVAIQSHFESNKQAFIDILRGEIREAEVQYMQFRYVLKQANIDSVLARSTAATHSKKPMSWDTVPADTTESSWRAGFNSAVDRKAKANVLIKAIKNRGLVPLDYHDIIEVSKLYGLVGTNIRRAIANDSSVPPAIRGKAMIGLKNLKASVVNEIAEALQKNNDNHPTIIEGDLGFIGAQVSVPNKSVDKFLTNPSEVGVNANTTKTRVEPLIPGEANWIFHSGKVAGIDINGTVYQVHSDVKNKVAFKGLDYIFELTPEGELLYDQNNRLSIQSEVAGYDEDGNFYLDLGTNLKSLQPYTKVTYDKVDYYINSEGKYYTYADSKMTQVRSKKIVAEIEAELAKPDHKLKVLDTHVDVIGKMQGQRITGPLAEEILYRLIIQRINNENNTRAVERIETYAETFRELIEAYGKFEAERKTGDDIESTWKNGVEESTAKLSKEHAELQLALDNSRAALAEFDNKRIGLEQQVLDAQNRLNKAERKIQLESEILTKRKALIASGVGLYDGTGKQFPTIQTMIDAYPELFQKNDDGDYVLSSNSVVRDYQNDVIDMINKHTIVDNGGSKITVDGSNRIVFDPYSDLVTETYTEKFKELQELEKELLSLKDPDMFDPNAELEVQVAWINQNFHEMASVSNMNDVYETLNGELPTDEELLEYMKLYSKSLNRTADENQRFVELRNKLLKWNTLNSLFERPVQEVVEEIAQENIDNEGEVKVNASVLSAPQIAESYEYSGIRLSRANTVEVGNVSLNNDVGILQLPKATEGDAARTHVSNVSAESFLSILFSNGYQLVRAEGSEKFEGSTDINDLELVARTLNNKLQKGHILYTFLTNDGKKVVVGKSSDRNRYYVFGKFEDTLDFFDNVGIKIVQSTNTRGSRVRYALMMRQGVDGNYHPFKGTENYTNDSGLSTIVDADAIARLTEDDIVHVVYDPTDAFNRTLETDRIENESRLYLYDKDYNFLGILGAWDGKVSKGGREPHVAVIRKHVFADAQGDYSKMLVGGAKMYDRYFNYVNGSVDSSGNYLLHDINPSLVSFKGYIKEGRVYDNKGVDRTDDFSTDSLLAGLVKANLNESYHVVSLNSYGRDILLPLYPSNADVYNPAIDAFTDITYDANSEVVLNDEQLKAAGLVRAQLPGAKITKSEVDSIVAELTQGLRENDKTVAVPESPYLAGKLKLRAFGVKELTPENKVMLETGLSNKLSELSMQQLNRNTCS